MGWSILIGGLLGLGLTLFHLVIEHRLEPHVLTVKEQFDEEAFQHVLRRLRLIPPSGAGRSAGDLHVHDVRHTRAVSGARARRRAVRRCGLLGGFPSPPTASFGVDVRRGGTG
ncbi:MAG: hypothetical protein HND48_24355 [Chloroflexi bacterium]|nr:hypothetical protein [Chloroflexota bacterium]